MRSILTFFATFVAGALIALVGRAALYNPNADRDAGMAGEREYAPMVSNALTPATPPAPVEKSTAPSPAEAAAPAPAAAPDEHAHHAAAAATDAHDGHGAPAAASASDATKPVNTLCAICGMPVDPKIPTATYQGKTIGFGCRMCPPKFKADPDRYGPLYLKNEVVKR